MVKKRPAIARTPQQIIKKAALSRSLPKELDLSVGSDQLALTSFDHGHGILKAKPPNRYVYVWPSLLEVGKSEKYIRVLDGRPLIDLFVDGLEKEHRHYAHIAYGPLGHLKKVRKLLKNFVQSRDFKGQENVYLPHDRTLVRALRDLKWNMAWTHHESSEQSFKPGKLDSVLCKDTVVESWGKLEFKVGTSIMPCLKSKYGCGHRRSEAWRNGKLIGYEEAKIGGWRKPTEAEDAKIIWPLPILRYVPWRCDSPVASGYIQRLRSVGLSVRYRMDACVPHEEWASADMHFTQLHLRYILHLRYQYVDLHRLYNSGVNEHRYLEAVERIDDHMGEPIFEPAYGS